MSILLADIGGTNSRCAVGTRQGRIEDLAIFQNASHAGVADLLSGFLARLPQSRRPHSAMLAIAAPILNDQVSMINIGWHFSRQELQHRLGLSVLHVLNDFAALAWALPALAPEDAVQVGGGKAVPAGAKVVLGPGTGLGVASLVSLDGRWHAIPGEGGHVTLPAQDEQEESLIRRARERFGHCSAERLLSGPGLSFLHEALHGGPGLIPEAIGERVLAGDRQAVITAEVFFRFLGTVAGDFALTLGAFGGVYIGGGIVRRYCDALRASGFRRRFEAKGRYQGYLRAIPTYVITAEHPALTGLLAYAMAQEVP
jgi:glucokinase